MYELRAWQSLSWLYFLQTNTQIIVVDMYAMLVRSVQGWHTVHDEWSAAWQNTLSVWSYAMAVPNITDVLQCPLKQL